jgi:hypothetical protein
MPSPFPGMDPYVERPEVWPDCHDRLITYICDDLNPLLKPRYVAVTADRLYVVEAERSIKPDVSVLRTPSRGPAGTAVLEVDAPAVFPLQREEIREPLIHILEPTMGNRVVTAIEILSPDNKRPGEGRKSYLKKREEYWENRTNLVEIDLLHEGERTVRVSAEKLAALQPWRYLVAVTRCWPARQEVYAVPLERRLPRVAVPLSEEGEDVCLDLQALFTLCWDRGAYPYTLFYGGPPPGKWTPDEIAWCEELLRQAGHRPEVSSSS